MPRDHSLETAIFDIYPESRETIKAARHDNNKGRTFTYVPRGARHIGGGLRLSFARQPTSLRAGYVFGSDHGTCDVLLPGQPRKCFAVSLVPPLGLPLVTDLAGGLGFENKRLKRDQAQVIVQGARITCGNVVLTFRQPSRGRDQEKYEQNLRNYLG